MALLDLLTPRFAIPQAEAHGAIRRMVRVFFAPDRWTEAERLVDERFARKERYGSVDGETGGPYAEQPSRITWKPYEAAPSICWVEVSSRQFGHHLVDMIAMEHSAGRKVQPFPQGFRLERPIGVDAFSEKLAGVLGHPVDLKGHLNWAAKLRLVLELLGGLGGKDAPAYHEWLRSLSPTMQARVKAAHDFVWSKRRARELIQQIGLDTGGLATLLQEGSGLRAGEAVALAGEMLGRFPPDLDWQTRVYSPLRIPIETDWLEVDYTYPCGMREGAPYVPEGQPLGSVGLILQPDTAQPLLSGLYDRQCLILDAVDEIRKAFGLPPDARYDHYRSRAMRDS